MKIIKHRRTQRFKFPRKQFNPRLAQLFTEVSEQLGYRAEEVIDEAFALARANGVIPFWLHGWARQDRYSRMDKMGVDYVFKTDAGDIWVQIKSSQYAAAAFKARSQDEAPKIIVIVVDVTDHPIEVYNSALLLLQKERDSMYEQRLKIVEATLFNE